MTFLWKLKMPPVYPNGATPSPKKLKTFYISILVLELFNHNSTMSRNANVKSSAKVAAVQKFCQFCMNIGKTEAEYRSHFTRESPDPNSKVVCPELLALNCRYCLTSGHTVKYCPQIKQKNKKNEWDAKAKARIATQSNTKIASQPTTKVNRFSYLNDSSSEDEVEVEVNDEFPALCVESKHQPVYTGYAAALVSAPKPKPAIVYTKIEAKPKIVSENKPENKPENKSLARPAPWVAAASTTTNTKNSWAAFDSDDEDDADFDTDEEHDLYNKDFDLEDDTW
jgi:hypothetical protein